MCGLQFKCYCYWKKVIKISNIFSYTCNTIHVGRFQLCDRIFFLRFLQRPSFGTPCFRVSFSNNIQIKSIVIHPKVQQSPLEKKLINKNNYLNGLYIVIQRKKKNSTN